MSLEGQHIVVTGAARGLGRAIAETVAKAGARVALVDILEEELAVAGRELEDAGCDVVPCVADTTEPDQVEDLAARLSTGAPVTGLVNNAGTFSVVAPVWEADPERWLRDIRTNLYGSFLCCRAFVRGMVERGAGRVINIVSSGGVGDPHPYSTSYAASKTGLMRLTEGLAAEARDHGVSVFAVGPPAIRTAMTQFLVDDPGSRKWRPTFQNIFTEGRDSPPALVADMIVRLFSGEADALSGRFFDPKRGLDAYLVEKDRILDEDAWTLRIRGR